MILVNDNLYAIDTARLEQAIRRLPAWRCDVVLRYKHEQGRRQSLLAYQLLCEGLKQHFGISEMPRFEMGEHGKPYLPDYPQIHFNLSHCAEAVACAIDTRPVGIDIETFRPVKESILRYAMSEDEIHRIHQSPCPERTFATLWTQKEALVKLTGRGITHALPHLLHHTTAQMQTLLTRRYACTLASR